MVTIATNNDDGDVFVFEFAGEFNHDEVHGVSLEFEACIAAGHRRFVFDLAKLTFITSVGVGWLLMAQKKANAEGGGLVLVAPSAFMTRLFDLLGMDDAFFVFPSVAEGVRYWGASDGGAV